jgi:hypothetical protein
MESPTKQGAQAASSGSAERAVQNVKLCFAFTGLCRFVIQENSLADSGIRDSCDIGFFREIQCGIPSSTNEFTYRNDSSPC